MAWEMVPWVRLQAKAQREFSSPWDKVPPCLFGPIYSQTADSIQGSARAKTALREPEIIEHGSTCRCL